MTVLIAMVNVLLSVLGYVVCRGLIKEYIPIFISRKMYGNDQCKKTDDPIPEPMGVICAAAYLIVMFVFIPFPFIEWIGAASAFPYAKFLSFLSALISICTAILLGFADDMLDLKWRHKLAFPTLSSLPILMVYYVSGGSTTVIIPSAVRTLLSSVVPPSVFPSIPSAVDINIFYYVFMCMVVVFCTNAINILAGINGLESGQAIILAMSVIVYNLVQIGRLDESWDNMLSLYFLIPFLACTSALFQFNNYPARVFVGDTFCYWAGMTLAVVSILGHFSKTMILFLIPQVFNFLYSIPQLFKLVPCPRHRLPKFDGTTNTVGMSVAQFKEGDLKLLGRISLRLLSTCGLLYTKKFEKDGERWQEINNLTILNLVLKFAGPLHERTLTNILLSIQVICSVFAFFVRFYLASFLYDVVN
ncbi:UDP-N-acetylglucosamine--dolichyl-phosphate N-acetylglucosaminephosphotransferase [Trichostrongylus colubriformis]|uniref:UDP-N-acetylglucosamine--dolichyl-phosphate N-acetylglucosaminephosphotransferase n=1 Tax=Trichostrongylus colubriformis TaxID=6319 RepID=A0AAN8FL44_TRICO